MVDGILQALANREDLAHSNRGAIYMTRPTERHANSWWKSKGFAKRLRGHCTSREDEFYFLNPEAAIYKAQELSDEERYWGIAINVEAIKLPDNLWLEFLSETQPHPQTPHFYNDEEDLTITCETKHGCGWMLSAIENWFSKMLFNGGEVVYRCQDGRDLGLSSS